MGRKEPKTAALVAANLRRQIVRGDLVAGDTLPAQHLLTEQYQVSRPILREAYRILESEQLIEVRRGAKGGARVRMPSAEVAATQVGLILEFGRTTLADVDAARRTLETPAAALVAADHDDSGLARLRANLDAATAAMDESGIDPQAKLSITRDFHGTIVALSGNNTLTLLDSVLSTIIDQIRDDAVSGTLFDTCHRAHQMIYDLIASGDVTAADELWRRHVDDVATTMTRFVGDTLIDVSDR
jgi:GntR family transcriptional regulator, transcriptional repressor for pyruvate dehydrogenase complex